MLGVLLEVGGKVVSSLARLAGGDCSVSYIPRCLQHLQSRILLFHSPA